MKRRVLAALFASALVGCDDAPLSPPLGTPDDIGGDDTTFDAPDLAFDATDAPDATEEPPDPCGSIAVAGDAFDLFPDTGTTQINADADRDDDGLWLVFNTRGEEDGFDIWMARLSCDGSTTVVPTKINTAGGPGAIEPQIAVGTSSVLVVWQTDTSTLENNLDIVVRAFDLDGTPRGPERTLEMQRNGAPNPGNTWMPALSATDDGFLLVGAWGHSDAPAFQAFAQRLTADGEPVNDAQDVHLNADAGQTYPSLAYDEDDGALIAWSNTPLEGDESADVARLNGTNPFAATAGPFSMTGTTGVAQRDGTGLFAASAFNNRSADVAIALVDRSGVTSNVALSGDPFRTDHTPTPALQNAREGAVIYYRTVQGFQNEAYVASVAIDDTVTLGDAMRLDDTATVAPYTPILVPLGDDSWFVAWSEGSSPDFVLRGRFMQL